MGAEPIRVGPSRSNVVLTIGMLVFLGGVEFYAVKGIVAEPGAQMGYVVAAIFAIPLVLLVLKVRTFLRPRSTPGSRPT